MNRLGRTFNAIGGSLMARSGRVGILVTTGAKTGLPRRAPIGFVARPDGTILIGSGSPKNRGWTANLKAGPAATFSVKGVERRYRARLVGGGEREAALAELRAKMGGMAERADWGDLFVLEPEEPGVIEAPE
ncbi:MAG: nitroreductase family deazaflavin-dependent oxidoreductase [Chloroflexota bacterium]